MTRISDAITLFGYVVMLAIGMLSGTYLVYGSLDVPITIQSVLLAPFAMLAGILAAVVFLLALAGFVDMLASVYTRVIRQ